MQNCLKFLLTLAVFFCTARASYAQEQGKKDKKHTLELGYSILHYFDGSYTNWRFYMPSKEGKSLPDGGSLTYSRKLKNKNGRICFSVLNIGIAYNDTSFRSKQLGDILWRHYMIFSGGYSYKLIEIQGFKFYGLGNLIYRNGHESVHLYYYYWEQRIHSRNFNDWGFSGGLKVLRELPLGFNISAESLMQHYVFRQERGYKKHNSIYPFDNGSPLNVFQITYKVGYRF